MNTNEVSTGRPVDTVMKRTTVLENEIVEFAAQLVRYYREPAWAMEQEDKANELTGGNVTALSAIAQALNTRLERLLGN